MGERETEEKGQTAKKGRKRLGFHQTVLRNWNYQKAGASSLNPPRPRKETKALEFELLAALGFAAQPRRQAHRCGPNTGSTQTLGVSRREVIDGV